MATRTETGRSNGARTDAEEFYLSVTLKTPQELAPKLKAWERKYNHRHPHLVLKRKTPAKRLCELRISTPPTVRRVA